jgi:hypothetical protein
LATPVSLACIFSTRKKNQKKNLAVGGPAARQMSTLHMLHTSSRRDQQAAHSVNPDEPHAIIERDRSPFAFAAHERNAAWLDKCIIENGKPLPILANALIAIEAVMPQVFAYDEILRAPMLMMRLKPEHSFKRRIMRDVDVGIAAGEVAASWSEADQQGHGASGGRHACSAISSRARIS